MSRRRLRLHYSSSSDDDDAVPQAPPPEEHAHITEIQSDTVNLNPNFIHPEPVQISDDDEFIDVSNDFSPPSPPPSTALNRTSFQQEMDAASAAGFEDSYFSPIEDFLARLGLRVRREWLDDCIAGLQSSVTGFSNYDVAEKAKLCFGQFLYTDMNHSGGGALPDDVGGMHLAGLAGPFVLQVDEVINVSCPLRERYQKANTGLKRCLKLSMTDGVQRVFGMEYRPIKDLDVLAPAGFKVVICNVQIRHGLLMLVPEVIEVLGGLVEELDAARQRLVHEINKPPRGIRTRTREVPSLATRARIAAWSSDGNSGAQNTNRPVSQNSNGGAHSRHGSVSRNSNSFQANDSRVGVPLAASFIDTSQTILEELAVPTTRQRDEASRSTYAGVGVPSAASFIDRSQTILEEPAVQTTRHRDEASRSTHAVPDVHMVDENIEHDPFTPAVDEDMYVADEDIGLNHYDNPTASEDDYMFDEVEHPIMLTGDKEIPFTYLASMSAKWAATEENIPSIQGKIKCFLTGVKAFHFKQRSTYELRVYVDDGSLISELLIDHNVVQNRIGYSPEEVSAAIGSSNPETVSNMKETMKHYQKFLAHYEGTMLVELSGAFTVPVVLEMNQGCSTSDARSLLRRLKTFNSTRVPNNPDPSTTPISISP